jgi:hypothetical protein
LIDSGLENGGGVMAWHWLAGFPGHLRFNLEPLERDQILHLLTTRRAMPVP